MKVFLLLVMAFMAVQGLPNVVNEHSIQNDAQDLVEDENKAGSFSVHRNKRDTESEGESESGSESESESEVEDMDGGIVIQVKQSVGGGGCCMSGCSGGCNHYCEEESEAEPEPEPEPEQQPGR